MSASSSRASGEATAPGGLSWARFEAISAEAGGWLWGTAKGAFNEKASFSQIVVDAVIGMIPLVGDATAVRDLIAVVIGLVDQPKKREEVWEWVLLIVLIFALIPVWGGVIKGVGRLVVKAAREAELLAGTARAAKMGDAARDIIAFLNRIGSKNAEKWFLVLRIADYETLLLQKFDALIDVMLRTLAAIKNKVGSLMPASLASRFEGLKTGLAQIKELGAKMIPEAIKELDQRLREIQSYVRSGGQTTSRVTAHEVATGERAVTRADEARIIENGPLPARSSGGWKQNTAIAKKPKSYERVYKHEPGYPRLDNHTDAKTGHFNDIEAFSGKIINRPLKPGEQIFRFFGPDGTTHGTYVKQSYSAGAWWGLGAPPKTAKEWRESCAVLDEFNRDGYMVVATIPSGREIKAAVGTVSEQSGRRIPGQHLAGGSTQAVVHLEDGAKKALAAKADDVIKNGKPEMWIDPATGMKFEIKPTGWSDANGIHGYIEMPGPAAVQTVRLGAREEATKESREVFK